MEPQEADPIAVRTAAEAYALLRPRFERTRGEKIAVLHLRADGALLHVSVYSGNLDEAEVPVRRILRQALRRRSEALIIAHNHPSGDAGRARRTARRPPIWRRRRGGSESSFATI